MRTTKYDSEQLKHVDERQHRGLALDYPVQRRHCGNFGHRGTTRASETFAAIVTVVNGTKSIPMAKPCTTCGQEKSH
jgi:hypothetical protein